jgi:EmrB/QacA subfamily drug resistance transporter
MKKNLVLVSLVLVAFVTSLDTTIVNVAIPALARELKASDSHLQWIVDAFNLVFGALLISAGSISDRFGRKGMLVGGMAIFGAASYLGGLSHSWNQLIAARAVMGLGAALCFPATLSILTNVFKDRKEKAAAIGIWGAATGMAVAVGPIVGGWLLENFTWNSVFYVMAPIAIISVVMSFFFVPDSKDPDSHTIDIFGLVLSVGMMGTLVYTLIQAPTNGWGSSKSIVGYSTAFILLLIFIWQERRVSHPMLDVRIFTDMRFTAASQAIAIGFFALFGFTFIIVQYFQVIKGYAPLQTGVRILPIAFAFVAGSIIGTQAAVKAGNKVVVTTGLTLATVFYLWIAKFQVVDTSYLRISLQMVVGGLGMGLLSTGATEAIMGSVSEEKAGVGSAVNESARLLGGTLGLAVIGSVYDSMYVHRIHSYAYTHLPNALAHTATKSVQGAYGVIQGLTASGQSGTAMTLRGVVQNSFMHGLRTACFTGAMFVLFGALISLLFLPAHPSKISINK